MTAVTHAAPINLEDAAPALGDLVGTVMSGLDAALAEVADDRWKDGVRDAVIREAAHEVLELFTAGMHVKTIEQLDGEAVRHLGRYAAARARSLTLQDRIRRESRNA